MKTHVGRYALFKRLPDGSSTLASLEKHLGDAEEKARVLAENFGGEYFIQDVVEDSMVMFIHNKKAFMSLASTVSPPKM